MKEVPAIVSYDPVDWQDIHIPKFRDADRCWKFLKKHGFRRLPIHAERVFLKNLELAIDYARRIHSRLPIEFENEIRKNVDLTWKYISNVIMAPMKEFEDTLKEKPSILVRYSKDILEGRLPEHLEESLIGDPYACFEYAWQILDGRLPEHLHNYMFGANMDTRFGKRYRGCNSKLNEACEYNPDYACPSEYFEFIKWQRKNLHRLIIHYQNIYGVDSSKSVGEFLYELEHGR